MGVANKLVIVGITIFRNGTGNWNGNLAVRRQPGSQATKIENENMGRAGSSTIKYCCKSSFG
jgi:hypothetical protein